MIVHLNFSWIHGFMGKDIAWTMMQGCKKSKGVFILRFSDNGVYLGTSLQSSIGVLTACFSTYGEWKIII